MPSDKPQIVVRVDAATKARWEAAAERDGVPLSELVRAAVELHIRRGAGERTDAAARARLAARARPSADAQPRDVPARTVAAPAPERAFRPDFKAKHQPK